MEWFKHPTGSHDDPDLSDAWDKFGDAGVVIFWVILEIYGNEFNSLSECGTMDVSIKFLERKLRRRWSGVAPKLVWFQSRGRILFEVDGDRVKIRIPKFLDLASNWTKRTKKPTEVPTEVAPEQPTAKNRREEEEKKKRIEEKETTIPEWISKDAWTGFLEHRKKIKAPLTGRAITLTLNKLEGFKNSGQDPNAILNQSVEMGWKGIFQIGGDNGRAAGGTTKAPEKTGRARSDGAEYPVDHEFS